MTIRISLTVLICLLGIGETVPISAAAGEASGQRLAGAADSTSSNPAPFDAGQVVARVGSKELTLGELMVRFASLPHDLRAGYGDRLDLFLRDTAANLAVSRRAVELGVEEDPLFDLLLEIKREEILRDLYARRTVLSDIDEETLAKVYQDGRLARFQRHERVRLRHILVTPAVEPEPFNSQRDDATGAAEARAKAESIASRLAAGEDFALVARELSEDGSAAHGGDLGWMRADELLPELRKVSARLEIGMRSDLIESSVGLHFIEIIDRRPGGQVPPDLVRELLYQEVVGRQAPRYARDAAKDREKVVSQTEIETFPELLPW